MSDLAVRARTFALAAHAGHTRKGAAAEPYSDHLADLAGFVLRHGGDEVAVAAAWLHDTVEDVAGVTLDRIRDTFGEAVAGIVAERTDDKSMDKAERKRLQVAHAPAKSPRAALVKAGDKTSNVTSVADSPAAHWSVERCRAYVDWAAEVVAALPRLPKPAREEFQAAVERTRRVLDARAAGQG